MLSITEVAAPLSQGGMYPSFSFTFCLSFTGVWETCIAYNGVQNDSRGNSACLGAFTGDFYIIQQSFLLHPIFSPFFSWMGTRPVE